MTETLEQTLSAYDAWLDRQPLAAKTRIAYPTWYAMGAIEGDRAIAAARARRTLGTRREHRCMG